MPRADGLLKLSCHKIPLNLGRFFLYLFYEFTAHGATGLPSCRAFRIYCTSTHMGGRGACHVFFLIKRGGNDIKK